MLAEGKITPSEAESLLDALGRAPSAQTDAKPADPKYLRVQVDGHDDQHGGKVNVRVPFSLIRAGVRLAALLPSSAYGPVNKALHDNGIDVDVSKLKPENLDDLVTHLRDLTVDVEGHHGEKVRVFCE
jgi:hypothetical protein